MSNRTPKEILAFAAAVRESRLPGSRIQIGEIQVKARHAEIDPLQYNKKRFELMRGAHDYRVGVGGTEIDLSVQLYLNSASHYRLFAYARSGSGNGMTFSVNLTTSKDAKGAIGLSQKLRFIEGRSKSLEEGRQIRLVKARILADILARCGLSISDNLEVNLGTFSAKSKTFLDTTPEQFLSDFLTVALLKGHFQGNKGYQFSCLPRFDDSFDWRWDSSEAVRQRLQPHRKGKAGSRVIPLGLRFHVLERDQGRCLQCGRSSADGVNLHVDHVVPFSCGGLTILSNLQTLCQDCNLGKGNRSDRFYGKRA